MIQGRGIALQLGQAGATVYVTGRKPAESDAASESYLPSLENTAKGFFFFLTDLRREAFLSCFRNFLHVLCRQKKNSFEFLGKNLFFCNSNLHRQNYITSKRLQDLVI